MAYTSLPIKKRFSGINQAMLGQGPFSLPQGYGFDDLANYEEARRQNLGVNAKDKIAKLRADIQGTYDQSLGKYRDTSSTRRASLSSSLGETAKKQFEMQNPYLLQDLNSRGLASSPTEVARAQGEIQKQLALESEGRLGEFDKSTRDYEDSLTANRMADLNQLDMTGTSAELQANQDALDSALDLRRGSLESSLAERNSAEERALAESLAAENRKAGLTNSLIGAGGGLLGGLLAGGGKGLLGGGGGGGGFLSSLPLFGGGGGATASSSVIGGGAFPVAPGAASGGVGFLPAAALLGGGALGASLFSRAGEKKAGALGGIIGNPIGYQINHAKDIISNPGKVIKNVAAKPLKAVSNIGSSISKSVGNVFCFDEETPVAMADGTTKMICEVDLGEETKGGIVESVRISITPKDTLYFYKDVKVTGSHAVKEDNEWIRVQDSSYAVPLKNEPTEVWSIVTDKHRVFVYDHEFADEHETDSYEYLGLEASLEELNKSEIAAKEV